MFREGDKVHPVTVGLFSRKLVMKNDSKKLVCFILIGMFLKRWALVGNYDYATWCCYGVLRAHMRTAGASALLTKRDSAHLCDTL